MMNSPENKQTKNVAINSGTGNVPPDSGLSDKVPHTTWLWSHLRQPKHTPSNRDGPKTTKKVLFDLQGSEAETMDETGTHHTDKTADSPLSRSSVELMMQRGLRRCSFAMVSLVLFLILTGTTIGVGMAMKNDREQDIHRRAAALADEAGQSLSEQLNKAIVPLYSLAKFATHLKVFRELPSQIAALPIAEGGSPRLNISSLCNDPKLVDVFEDIAIGAKEHARVDRALANIQFQPYGVICLVHPWNNTEDFDDGAFLDSTGVLGSDLLSSWSFGHIARDSMIRGELTLSGPRPLTQCPHCGPFYIARLPVVDENNEIVMDGKPYPRWGFVTVLIKWTQFLEVSRVHDRHAENDFEFQLTRTDFLDNPSTGESIETTVLLAESAGFQLGEDGYGYVTTFIDTIDGEWELVVAYDHAEIVRSTVVVVTVCVFISFLISGLVYVVLNQRRVHTMMQVESLAQETRVDTERNMTAYFAHELRNPLSALDSALQFMSHEDLLESSKELLKAMKLCSSFMSSIMNNLLDARKLEAGKMKLKTSPLSLSALVDDCRKMMESSVRPGVAFLIRKEIPSGHNWVLGDERQIQQVLTNVLTNAIKYTLEGSIALVVSWESGLVQFECIDTGPGIPLSEQGRLFERFVQRGGAPGTGLGLSIAKLIVDMMDGTINFISDPTDKPGTTCQVRLPLQLCEQREEVHKAVDEEAIQQEISILIVDDIKMNQVMLERRIKKGIAPNAKITKAQTGEQAIELCKETDFDVVICDQYMEEAGGVLVGTDTIIAMRRNNVSAFIIGCSGDDMDDTFRNAGADSVWGKPLPNNAEIMRQFRTGLDIRLQRRDLEAGM